MPAADINTGAIDFDYCGRMTDSIERLYRAILAARDLDPARSRTAKLMQQGRAKMAKKIGEEAIEVAIDAVGGDAQAVVRESADLLYNLAVLWAELDIQPEDVWREMERRELMLGIAEKLPKSPAKVVKAAPGRVPGRPIVAAEGRTMRKRH
ncbi:phosphoribosyl-ATP pyrophosphatase 2 [Bradyrhizobium sp. SSBR45G]|nr:phosphoribosyl-ATP pyrophosphatase 2 [Bradyrhizobium sp. SSBR45G]GLH84649.1 phosphoribosyl-ATP pyrophosphatase 2 [Bradyrhizobium sp. SSBR45R]